MGWLKLTDLKKISLNICLISCILWGRTQTDTKCANEFYSDKTPLERIIEWKINRKTTINVNKWMYLTWVLRSESISCADVLLRYGDLLMESIRTLLLAPNPDLSLLQHIALGALCNTKNVVQIDRLFSLNKSTQSYLPLTSLPIDFVVILKLK